MFYYSKKTFTYLLLCTFLFGFAVQAIAAPTRSNQISIWPFVDSTYELGSSTKAWLGITTDTLYFTGGDTMTDFDDITITESQISDLTHTTDTNANTICAGTIVYLDGEGNCDTLISSPWTDEGTVLASTDGESIRVAYIEATSTATSSTFAGGFVAASSTITGDFHIVGESTMEDSLTLLNGVPTLVFDDTHAGHDKYRIRIDADKLNISAGSPLIDLMTFDSTNGGNIGIGSTSPSSKLTVAGNGFFGGGLTATGTLDITGLSTLTGGFIAPSSTVVGDFTATTLFGNAENATLARIGNSTFSTVQDLQNIFHSAGWVAGGSISDAGGETIDVAAGNGLIRTSNSAVVEIDYFDWVASTSIAIPTDSVRYIGIEYNAGSPRIAVRTTYNWNLKTDFPLGNVINESTDFHIENAPQAVGDHAANMIERTFETLGKARDNLTGGLILGETGTREVTLSAGTLWERLQAFDISAIDTSSSGGFDTYCDATRIGTASTTWDNANYCNSGTLTALSNNRYVALWFYVELDGALIMVYGTSQFVSEAGAEGDTEPSTVHDRVSIQSKLIGRMIVQQGASVADSVETVFATTFSGALVTDHGNLAGLSDDDHTQYLLADGTRLLTGDWNAGAFTIFATSTDVTNASTTNLSASGYFDFLGTVITNVSTWFNGLFDTQLATKDTDDLTEGTNLYFTNARADARINSTTTIDTLTTLSNLTSVGTIATGVWNGTAIDISDYTNLTAGRSLTLTDDSMALDAEIYTKTFTLTLPQATSTDDGLVRHFLANAITITSVDCQTDAGTVDSMLEQRVKTTPYTVGTDILAGTLVCDTNNQNTTSFNDATVPADTFVSLIVDDTAAGQDEDLSVTVTYTIDD